MAFFFVADTYVHKSNLLIFLSWKVAKKYKQSAVNKCDSYIANKQINIHHYMKGIQKGIPNAPLTIWAYKESGHKNHYIASYKSI